jgi:hypothetical protein
LSDLLVTSFAIVSYFLLFLSISLYLKAVLYLTYIPVQFLQSITGWTDVSHRPIPSREDTKLLQINKEIYYEKELIAHDCGHGPDDCMRNNGSTVRHINLSTV